MYLENPAHIFPWRGVNADAQCTVLQPPKSFKIGSVTIKEKNISIIQVGKYFRFEDLYGSVCVYQGSHPPQ